MAPKQWRIFEAGAVCTPDSDLPVIRVLAKLAKHDHQPNKEHQVMMETQSVAVLAPQACGDFKNCSFDATCENRTVK